jgi:hypothetical protein
MRACEVEDGAYSHVSIPTTLRQTLKECGRHVFSQVNCLGHTGVAETLVWRFGMWNSMYN